MILVLFRHGPAGDREEFAKISSDDSKRNLTEEGKKKTKKVSKGLSKIIGESFTIYSSPYNRAFQTAEILSKESKFAKDVRISEALEPDRNPGEFLAELPKLNENIVVAVGHEPHLSSLASEIVFGEVRGHIKLKKAGAIAIRIPDSKGESPEFLWLLTPNQIIKSA